MKDYTVTISLNTVEIHVRAKNEREAKRKAIEKMDGKKPSKFMDKQNTFTHERFY